MRASALQRHDRRRARRATASPLRHSASARRSRRRPGLTLLDCARLRRRLADHGLQGVPGHEPGGEGLRLRTSASVDELRRTTTAVNGTTYYYKVSAANAYGEGPRSNEASATPIALVPPDDALSLSTTSTAPNENPLSDAGRWTNGDQRRGRDGPERDLEQARLLGLDDLHRVAQQRPVRARRRGVGADRDPAGSEQRASPLRPPPAARLRSLRRLHAAHESARRPRRGLPRARATTAQSRGFSRSRRSLSAGDTLLLLRARARPSRSGATTEAPGRGLASLSTRTYATLGSAGVGLRGTTGRLDDFGARTLGSASAPTAPLSLQATSGNAQVSSVLEPARVRRRLAAHGLQGVPRHEPGRRRSSVPSARRLARATPTRRRQRHHLLLQGARP